MCVSAALESSACVGVALGEFLSGKFFCVNAVSDMLVSSS